MRASEIILEDRIEYLKNTFNKKIERKLQSDNEAKELSITTPDQLVDYLAQHDPDIKKRHVQWMVQRWLEGNLKLEDAYKAEDTFPKYDQLKRKNKLTPEQKDIFNFKTIADIDAAIAPLEKTSSKKETKKEEYKKMEKNFYATGQAELLYKGPEGKIVIPKTEEASCFFGMGTKWCTAATKSDNAFDEYKDDPLFILLTPQGKFQLSFASKQYMNEFDQSIDPLSLPKKLLEAIGDWIIKYRKDNIFGYADDVKKGRWREVEPYILTDPKLAYYYSRDVIKDRWPEEAETFIKKDQKWAYYYSRDVIKDRWPEAEPYIMKNSKLAYYYSRDVIKGRWSEAEPYIMKKSWYAYQYAKYIIKGRWPEAEPIIKKDPQWAYEYAEDIIKGRWPEAEPYIMKSVFADDYRRNVLNKRG